MCNWLRGEARGCLSTPLVLIDIVSQSEVFPRGDKEEMGDDLINCRNSGASGRCFISEDICHQGRRVSFAQLGAVQ